MRHSRTKNAFWDVNNKRWRKWCKFDSHFLFNNTYGLHVLTVDTKGPNGLFCFIGWSTVYFCLIEPGNVNLANNDIRLCFLYMRHSWNKNAFWDVNSKKWRKWCLFHFSYLITPIACMYSQMKPNVQINYFLFDWPIMILFVLNTDWKRDSFQIMIFVNVWWTLGMVELKTRFESWITTNDLFTFLI
jgi:hypothetical protein